MLSVCVSPAPAQEEFSAALSPTQEKQAIGMAETIGMAIFRHDRAAAVATDAMLGIPAIRDDKRLQGWVTEDDGSDIAVTFFGTPAFAKESAALYRVQISADGRIVGEPVTLKGIVPLTPYESAAAAARQTALGSSFQPCAENYNSVVLPPDADASHNWLVYLLPGTTDEDEVPIGGTYRVELDSGGTKILSERRFTNTCIVLSKSDTEVENTVALTISHLLDPVPTEAHVFWSLWSGLPMYVSTAPNETVWVIENGKIRMVDRGTQKAHYSPVQRAQSPSGP